MRNRDFDNKSAVNTANFQDTGDIYFDVYIVNVDSVEFDVEITIDDSRSIKCKYYLGVPIS